MGQKSFKIWKNWKYLQKQNGGKLGVGVSNLTTDGTLKGYATSFRPLSDYQPTKMQDLIFDNF